MTNVERAVMLVVAVALAGRLGHRWGLSACAQQSEREGATVIALRGCSQAGLRVNTLDLLPATGAEKARELLHVRLDQ